MTKHEDTDEANTNKAYRSDELGHEAADGTELSIRVFYPSRPDPNNPVPVLLQRTPYGKPDDLEEHSFAPLALDHGYAVAYEDTRGRGESGGEFLPWIHEAEDGAATVEWLASQSWSTGDVGMFGGSSPGQVQLFAAAEQPDGLAAIAPMFAPSDLHRSDFFQDGAMSAMTFLTWSLGSSVAGHTVDRLVLENRLSDEEAEAVHEALETALERLPELVAHRPLADLPESILSDVDLPDDIFPYDIAPHWETWVSRPTYDEFWRSFDPEVAYDRIMVPGLHITGWYELCQNGTLTNFAGLRDCSSAPQHLVVGPWAHQNTSSELGEIDFGSAAALDAYGLWETQLAFFDTYVRGSPRSPFADGNRFVETYRSTVVSGAGGGEWASHNDWPPADAYCEKWYLHSNGNAATDSEDGHLSRTRHGKFEPVDTWTHDPMDPVPTRGGPLCCGGHALEAGMFDRQNIEQREDICTYTTPPFEEPVELAGSISVTLTAATTAVDTDFTATLAHVTSDGPVYNLCEGIQRARYRYGRDRETPVRPDEAMQITIDMWDIHYVVPTGDCLRLEVASSNHPRFDPHPGTDDPWQANPGDVISAKQTVFHEHARESVLEITCR